MEAARILIVEDERIISLDLKHRLEQFGHSVVGIVSTAREAIAQTDSLKPDIILMDIMLGGEMDGIEAADEIRHTHPIPVVFVTAYADDETLARVKAAQPAGYILKPFKERELYSTIDIAIYKNQVDREMRKQEQWFDAVLHSIADGIVATNSQGRIRLVNAPATSITGFTEEEAVGLPYDEVLQLYDSATGLRSEVLPQGGFTTDDRPLYLENCYLRSKHGAEVEIQGTVAPIHTDDQHTEGIVFAFRDVTEIKRMSDTIVYQASHDSLTGLLNRDELFSRISDIITENADESESYSFIYVDLDQFKIINDVCGHEAGDELLRQVAGTLSGTVADSALVSRLGGDEFGVVLPDTDLEAAQEVADSLLQHLRRKFVWHKHVFNITASIGVVPMSSAGDQSLNVLAAADDACYLAKEEGGNATKVYQRGDRSFRRRRGEMQWISRLNAALEEDRFELYHQLIGSIDDGGDTKIEILLRLRESDDTIVSPGVFIPAAERYNLMPHIDRWVLNAVVAYAQRQRELSGSSDLYCVNISGASLVDDSFLEYVVDLLRRSSIDPASLCLEITETSAIENLSRAVGFMHRLRQLGTTFALDDFGNGFSSFSYLKQLPADYLKIDGSFVRNCDSDPIDRGLVQSVNNIGHVMGMATIAEFVENERVLETLKRLGVDYAQGYAVGHPGPLPPLTIASTKR
jgi:diguanylate cyclase (GGDEF)-like protein/PAS domain S-box-containing protein